MEEGGKITARQLSRKAIVYIRQSTTRQVRTNEESTRRQYALKDALVARGWAPELIEVVDCDLGISGKYSENREGFKRMVADVANGGVGAIASIEASRLSRNNADWSRIIDFCALTDTVIIDEDGVYSPVDPNDRLLLGVKASITEMELHYIRARMQGGLLNKAVRGELKIKVPAGYSYDPLGRIVMDPNKDVQEAVRKLFRVFGVQGSAYRTVAYFREHGILFPSICRQGIRKGELNWKPLTVDTALRVLKNPAYCGRYAYGRSKVVTTPARRSIVKKPPEEWIADIPGHHPAYITEEEFEKNQKTLSSNAAPRMGAAPAAAGRGSALLQGIVYCGKCGRRMSTCYQASSSKERRPPFPLYICDGAGDGTRKRCMQVNALAVDEKISELVRASLTEEAIKNAILIKEEVDSRWKENESVLRLQLERAEYEAGMMKKRYMKCDPDNALVRNELERAYNESLAMVIEAEKRLEAEALKHSRSVEENVREKLSGLVSSFGSVWDASDTDCLVKKKLLRYLVQDVTLTREDNGGFCKVQVVYAGGGTDEFTVMCNFYGPNATSWKVYDFLREHGTEHTASGLAEMMNRNGLTRSCGGSWNGNLVSQFMSYHKIETRKQHYRSKGYLTVSEAARLAGITHTSMMARIGKGKYDGLFVWGTDHMILLSPDAVADQA